MQQIAKNVPCEPLEGDDQSGAQTMRPADERTKVDTQLHF
jgi:hypothetical protein